MIAWLWCAMFWAVGGQANVEPSFDDPRTILYYGAVRIPGNRWFCASIKGKRRRVWIQPLLPSELSKP